MVDNSLGFLPESFAAKPRTIELMIDCGLNLFNHQFDLDRDEVVDRAKHSGVMGGLVVGTNLETSFRVERYCKNNPPLHFKASVGIHPLAVHHDLFSEGCSASAVYDSIRFLAHSDSVIAIGETGVDLYRHQTPLHEQLESFRFHLNLSKEVDKPLFLHERSAYLPFIQCIQEFSHPFRGVVHCFDGGKEMAKKYLDLGFYLGISGLISDKRRHHSLLDAISYIPLDRLLIETDAPYLTPHNFKKRPKRNEPAFIHFTYNYVASLIQKPVPELVRLVSQNAALLFGFKWDDLK